MSLKLLRDNMGTKNRYKEKKLSRVKKTKLTLVVLRFLDKGLYAKQIADKLKITKVTVHNHIQKLIKNGYLQEEIRSTITTYIITNKGKKALQENKLSLTSCISTIKLGIHLRLKIPIVKKGRPPEGFWTTINTRFKNSIIKHRDLAGLIEGISIRETSQALEINIKHQKLPTFKEIIPIIIECKDKILGYFMALGYVFDTKNWLINDIHSTIWTKETEQIAEKTGRFTVAFPWDRAKITPRDPSQQAKAWIDSTPEPNLETNDLDYAEAFIKMPVTVSQNAKDIRELIGVMNVYGKHLNAHLPVLKGMDKLIKKLCKKLDQKNIKEFL